MQDFIGLFRQNILEGGRWKYLTDGLATTVIVTIFALLIGLALGMLLALIRTAHQDLKPSWRTFGGSLLKIFNQISSLYITFIRGTPTTIQLLIMFNVFLVAIDNLLLVAILTFGLNSSAYMSEIFRGGIQSVSKGQKEAARSLGLSYLQMSKKVVMPQALKNSLPALGNEVITLFKETSICGFIGLMDLTRGSSIIVSQTFNATTAYFSAALIYLAVVLLLERVFDMLEKRTGHASN